MRQAPTALLLGASRGLGLALAREWCGRGWHVIATVRRPSGVLNELAAQHPGAVEIQVADVTNLDDLKRLRAGLSGRPLDVVFVNAGISLAGEDTPVSAHDADFIAMMLTNALGPVRAIELLEDLVGDGGVLAVMSSELASITLNRGSHDLYSASKAALNMLMKCFSARRPNDMRAFLLIAPGWVRTEMGGPNARLTIADSVPRIVDVLDSNRNRPGLRFLDRFGEEIPW